MEILHAEDAIEYIAGKEAHLYDDTDWDIDTVPVYLNPANLPLSIPLHEAERMVQEAISCWSWYFVEFYYAGISHHEYTPGAVTVNWQNGEQLASWYKDSVNGVCFTRIKGQNVQKGNRFTEGCRIYINTDRRNGTDRYTQATLNHEVGHSCGIAGHNSHFGTLMYRSSMGSDLSCWDVEMLDKARRDYAILHDRTRHLAIPNVPIPDPESEMGYVNHFVRLRPVPGKMTKWKIHDAIPWGAANDDLSQNSVRLGEPSERNGRHGQIIHLDDVRGLLEGQKVHIAVDMFFDGEDQTLELIADRPAS